MKANSMTRTINIFRTGRFTAMNGSTYSYSERDLDGMAAAYNSAAKGGRYSAPLCIGHPASNNPRYGHVNALTSRKGRLYATVTPDSTLISAVRGKRYKKVSAAFYPPGHQNNTTPGAWLLRHIGFLGAMPPAVKGLEALAFSESFDLSLLFAGLTGTASFAEYTDPDESNPTNIIHHVTQDMARTMSVSYSEALNITNSFIWSN
ncbi:hypothetical protein AID40_000066 [Salmonella enterica subsp. enterica serovar Louga]|nr:hypothetical protein [Salmonella enterica subsp. enterica]EDW2195399.1 hypothetical protein [Salmonella enterica subsp. enterica]EGI6150473.1 hypothetical protein [Salmonella enterica subsp. enterica serovar Louga]